MVLSLEDQYWLNSIVPFFFFLFFGAACANQTNLVFLKKEKKIRLDQSTPNRASLNAPFISGNCFDITRSSQLTLNVLTDIATG